MVTTKYAEYYDVVFAKTRNEAKLKLLDGDTVFDTDVANDPDLEYIEIKVRRAPQLDDMQDRSVNEIRSLCSSLKWRN